MDKLKVQNQRDKVSFWNRHRELRSKNVRKKHGWLLYHKEEREQGLRWHWEVAGVIVIGVEGEMSRWPVGVVFPIPWNARFLIAATVLIVDIRISSFLQQLPVSFNNSGNWGLIWVTLFFFPFHLFGCSLPYFPWIKLRSKPVVLRFGAPFIGQICIGLIKKFIQFFSVRWL